MKLRSDILVSKFAFKLNLYRYSVEGPSFYFCNLFKLALPLALAAPLLALLSTHLGRANGTTGANANNLLAGSGFGRLMVAFSPFPLALAFFSSVAHKEERFMYVVYPLLCLGAAVALEPLESVLSALAM